MFPIGYNRTCKYCHVALTYNNEAYLNSDVCYECYRIEGGEYYNLFFSIAHRHGMDLNNEHEIHARAKSLVKGVKFNERHRQKYRT